MSRETGTNELLSTGGRNRRPTGNRIHYSHRRTISEPLFCVWGQSVQRMPKPATYDHQATTRIDNCTRTAGNVSQNVPGSGLFFFDLLERVERYSETLPAMCLAVSRLRLQPGLIRRHPNSLEIRSLTAFYRNIRNRNRPQIFTCEIHLSLIGFTFPDISRPIGRGYFLS